MGVLNNTEPDFISDWKKQSLKLVPIIFSHGYSAFASHYVGHYLELASHGYIVFAIDH